MKVQSIFLITLIVSGLMLVGCSRDHSRTVDRDLGGVSSPDIPNDPIIPTNPPSIGNDPTKNDVKPDLNGPGGEPPNGGGATGGDEQPVPEPSTLVLVGSGIAIISLCKKRRKKSNIS